MSRKVFPPIKRQQNFVKYSFDTFARLISRKSGMVEMVTSASVATGYEHILRKIPPAIRNTEPTSAPGAISYSLSRVLRIVAIMYFNGKQTVCLLSPSCCQVFLARS